MTHGTQDRRETPRQCDADEHGIVAARVRPGHLARVIDVSAGGALIETTHRLLPGTVVELLVERGAQHTRVRGRVLRCAVVSVHPTWVGYRGAIGFDRHLPWLLDEEVGSMAGQARSAVPVRACATPQVM